MKSTLDSFADMDLSTECYRANGLFLLKENSPTQSFADIN